MVSFKPLRRLLCLGLLVTAVDAAAASTVVTAGYKVPTPVTVAPGQIITFFVHGIAANLNAPVRAEGTPLPMQLAGITAILSQFNPAVPVPIAAVEPLSPCADGGQAGCQPYAAVTGRQRSADFPGEWRHRGQSRLDYSS